MNTSQLPRSLTCSQCFARFAHESDLRHHTFENHGVEAIVGDEVLAKKFGEFAFFEATLVSLKPLIVTPKGQSEEIFVQKFVLPSTLDPSVFVKNAPAVVPLAMTPQKTVELEDKDIDQDIRDDSSVTSEALSVDISSEASFPAFMSSKREHQEVQVGQILPQYRTMARAQVRTYLTSDSEKLCVLEKGMTFHVVKTFEDFSDVAVAEFWERRFPEFPRSETLWYEKIDGKKLAKMQVEALRDVFNLNHDQAKLVRNSVRLAKRRVQAIFTLDSQVMCGWVALVKGKKLLAKRMFGNCPPTLLLNNLYVSRDFSRDAPRREHSLHQMLADYRKENQNCISTEFGNRKFFQNPSQTWYEETLSTMLKEAGAKIKKVTWDGKFIQSLRHGSEIGQVSMSKLKDNGRVKSFSVDRSGYTIPDTYAFVTFKSHAELKNFLAIDFSKFAYKGVLPLFSMTAELDRTYANLSLAPVV